MKLNLMGLVVFIAAFLALSFVLRNFVLGQTFDIVNEIVILITTVALIVGANWITKHAVHKESPLEIKPLGKTI